MCQSRKPHVHAVLICEWAKGAVIEVKVGGIWSITPTPAWDEDREYRIKPEPSDLERYGTEVGDVWATHGGDSLVVAKKAPLGGVITFHRGKLVDNVHLKRLLFRRGEVNKL